MTQARGVKRLCATCGTRFYDMMSKPVCPKCGAEFIIPPPPPPRRVARPPARAFEPTRIVAGSAEDVPELDADETPAPEGDDDEQPEEPAGED